MRKKTVVQELIAFSAIIVLASCSSGPRKVESPDPAAGGASSSAQPLAPGVLSQGLLTCSLNEDHRKAEIHPKGKGCEVEYFKSGQGKVIASSSISAQHCEDVVAKLKKHLTSSGYTCQ